MPKRNPLSWHETSRGVTMEGPFWKLNYDAFLGLFDLAAPRFPGFTVRWARARALYSRGDRRHTTGTDDGHSRTWQMQPLEDSHGPALRLAVQSGDSRRPALEFAATLYRDFPLLLLDAALHNTLAQPIAVQSLQPLEIDPEWGGRVSLGSPIAGLYGAGWQSWSPAGWKPARARDLRTRLSVLASPMYDAPAFRPLRPGHFRADTVGVLTPTGEGPLLLAGLLSTADQFGALQARLTRARPALSFVCWADNLPLAPGERLASEQVGLLLSPSGEDPFTTYGEALGMTMGGKVGEVAPSGWCSWPAFGPQVSEQDVLRQIDWLAEHRDTLPIQVVQIDDGWEQGVGDWEANERFPHGMGWLAERIRQAGLMPGLWLAPLIVHPKSHLARNHPEWLLRDERGRPVHAGFGSIGFGRGLDVTQPAVQEWLRQLISTATQYWGYSYLKLDFLYAAALPACRYRPDLTRAQALRRGLEIIRQTAGPQTVLLGCGCPLGPAIGLVDTMRVGQDVAPNWKPQMGAITPLVRTDPSFVGTINTVRNTLTRSWVHRRLWLNDPDPLIVRQSGNQMSEAEVRTMATVAALSGGSWVLGDDLTTLEAQRQPLTALALPLHQGRPRALNLLAQETPTQFVLELDRPWGRGWIVALFNWKDRPAGLSIDIASLGLPAAASCHVHEFWSGTYQRIAGTVRFEKVEAHGCRVFLLRPVEGKPQWVGSTLHVVQGQEVQTWESGPQGVTLTLEAGRTLLGSLLLWLPGVASPQIRNQGDSGLQLEPVAEGLWRVRVQAKGAGPCRIVLQG